VLVCVDPNGAKSSEAVGFDLGIGTSWWQLEQVNVFPPVEALA
jgi:hypothetical protein